jgi:hypothetical protein
MLGIRRGRELVRHQHLVLQQEFHFRTFLPTLALESISFLSSVGTYLHSWNGEVLSQGGSTYLETIPR